MSLFPKHISSTFLMLLALLCCHEGYAAFVADTIPLQAQQIGSRTVELTWEAGEGTTTVFRQYPGEEQMSSIATTDGNSWTDHHRRCVCNDTVRYSICRATDTGFAALMVSDNEPTAMATWGVVTVEDEQIRLRWNASTDTDIMGYLICVGTPNLPFDTVFGHNNTSYTYTASDALTVNNFAICAFDSCRLTSPKTEVCNNVVLGITSDPCSRTVHASWNSYANMPSGVGRYEVWISEDASAFRRAAQTEADATEASFEVTESCQTVSVYLKIVSADGTEEALSNRVNVQFSTTERPAYFYLRKVSVANDGKTVNIVAQTDPTFAATDYRLYRRVTDRPAAVVAHLTPAADGTLSWHDNSVFPSEEPCGYYFGVDDGCGRNEMRTATGFTILPELTIESEGVMLRWNAYGGWTGSTQYQIVSSPLDSDEWQLVGNTWESEYLMTDNADGMRRYKVQAFEGPDSDHQRDDSLQSVEVFHRPHTDIWMSNAFTPTETSNNYFIPTSQYINPEGYSFMVFNRQGLLIFSSTVPGEAWDGRYKGQMQPNGAYLYKITYRQNDGTDQCLVGTVMLLR